MRRLNLRPISFLTPFVFIRWRILSAIFRRNFYSVLFVLCIFYISHVSSVTPRPLSLFVSPRSPTRALLKNALSFFLRDLISRACSSSSSSASGAPPPSSSFLAHSVRGVTASWTFSRDAPLSSILEAATWFSSSVFTSFYLTDVQFSSSSGFSLVPVVAAGSVV